MDDFCLQIISFLIVLRGLITAKFIVYEELFNPILSDSFGFTDTQASYFFLALAPAQLGSGFIMQVQNIVFSGFSCSV